jgi:hypothetical protein
MINCVLMVFSFPLSIFGVRNGREIASVLNGAVRHVQRVNVQV